MSDEMPEANEEFLAAVVTLAAQLRVYFQALRNEGFAEGQALSLIIGWQAAMLGGAVEQQKP